MYSRYDCMDFAEKSEFCPENIDGIKIHHFQPVNKEDLSLIFTEEDRQNHEKMYWKLLHYKLFGRLHGIKTVKFLGYYNRPNHVRIDFDKEFKVNSDDYLIKNGFTFRCEEHFNPLWEYLRTATNVISAGGYTSTMFFDKPFTETSDIDLFVKKDRRLRDLISFIQQNFDVSHYVRRGYSILTIVLNKKIINDEEVKFRDIQIIAKDFNSISDIFDSFDMCHIKTALYLGDTYHTYDAKYSKENGVTISFQDRRADRINKIERYGLKLFNTYGKGRYEEKEVIIDESEHDEKVLDITEQHLMLMMNSGYNDKNYVNPDDTIVTVPFDTPIEPEQRVPISNCFDSRIYNFEFYKFRDHILYEEVDILNPQPIDKIYWKHSRLVQSGNVYHDLFKMVKFNEYFDVPCLLNFVCDVEYEKLRFLRVGKFYIREELVISGIKNYELISSGLKKIFSSHDEYEVLKYKSSDCGSNICVFRKFDFKCPLGVYNNMSVNFKPCDDIVIESRYNDIENAFDSQFETYPSDETVNSIFSRHVYNPNKNEHEQIEILKDKVCKDGKIKLSMFAMRGPSLCCAKCHEYDPLGFNFLFNLYDK